MNLLYLFITFLTLMILSSCGTTPPEASEDIATDRFVSRTDENNHTVILDEKQHLIFVNSIQGCKALHGDPVNALKEATYFCQHLHFYGKDDWRVPALDEIRNFSKGMDEEGLVPYYTFAACKRIAGIKPDNTLGTINTHNASPKFAEVPLKLPAGIRCVREY